MSDFPGRPFLLKGALVVFEAPIPVPTNVIIFQYNPETMTRKISQPAGGAQAGGGGSANPCSTAGDTRNTLLLPLENYQLSVELDAADRRVFRVKLTADGQRQFQRMAAEHEQWVIDLFAPLSQKQKKQLVDLLGELKAHVVGHQGS